MKLNPETEIFERENIGRFQIDLDAEYRVCKSRDNLSFLVVFFALEIQNMFSRWVRTLTNRAMTLYCSVCFLRTHLRVDLNAEYTSCGSNLIIVLVSPGQQREHKRTKCNL